jgi:hypothetical protein
MSSPFESCGLFGPEIRSDESNESVPGPSWRPARNRTHINRKKHERYLEAEPTLNEVRPDGKRAYATKRLPDPRSTGSEELDEHSDTSKADGEEDGGSSSGDDEYSGPYRGPHLDILSVEAIKARLTRSFQKYANTPKHLGQWAAWWPKTKVIKYHGLNSAEAWLLAVAVHEWWSELSDEVYTTEAQWEDGTTEEEKEVIRLRAREIALKKEAAVLNAKGAQKKGETIADDAEVVLRSPKRSRSMT